MVGILLALQVNNWNENRKAQSLSEGYTNRISEDLRQDQEQLKRLTEMATIVLSGIEDYFEFFKHGDHTLKEVLDSSLHATSSTPYFRYFPINYTFDEMQSAGYLGYLSEECREALSILSNDQEYMTIIQDRIITDAKNEVHERDKYLDESDLEFFKVLDVNQEVRELQQGLLHQHNFLRHIRSQCFLVLSWGEDFTIRQNEIIELLDK